jgi:hypothetical protein
VFQAVLEQAISAVTQTGEPRAHLATVGNHLQKLLSQFDSRARDSLAVVLAALTLPLDHRRRYQFHGIFPRAFPQN